MRGRERWRRTPALLDVLLCVVLIGYALPATLSAEYNGSHAVVDSLLMTTVALPILIRRPFPVGAAWAFAAGCVVSGIPTFDQLRIPVAIPVALILSFTLASRCDRGRSLVGLAGVAVGLVVIGITDGAVAEEGGVLGTAAFTYPLCGVCWGAGRLVRSRERVAAALRERSAQLAEQRERTAALAVELERDRLAADLDAAASAPLQEVLDTAARAARATPAGEPVDRDVFARIEGLARGSLNEMRSLLGVLRSDGADVAAPPPPSLAEIDALLAHARAGGRVVTLDVQGEPRPLGVATELAAYRAVQNALAAVGGDAQRPAAVRLRYVPEAIEVEVDGPGLDGSGAEAALMAVRERVAAHGGRFSADSGATTGRRVVRARLPALQAVG